MFLTYLENIEYCQNVPIPLAIQPAGYSRCMCTIQSQRFTSGNMYNSYAWPEPPHAWLN